MVVHLFVCHIWNYVLVYFVLLYLLSQKYLLHLEVYLNKYIWQHKLFNGCLTRLCVLLRRVKESSCVVWRIYWSLKRRRQRLSISRYTSGYYQPRLLLASFLVKVNFSIKFQLFLSWSLATEAKLSVQELLSVWQPSPLLAQFAHWPAFIAL